MKSDFEKLAILLEALGADIATMHYAILEGQPPRKMRPKFGRRGRHSITYQPKEDAAAEAKTAALLREVTPVPHRGNIALAAIFYRSDRQVIDTDNLIKHLCDAGNGVLFLDDSQATATAGIIELDPQRPRTAFAIARHTSTMKRGSDNLAVCQVCASPFSLEGKPATQQNCSTTCATISRRKDWKGTSHGST